MKTNIFKYHKYHSVLECLCPFNGSLPIEKEVYRFVFEDLAHKNNYLPPYIISPTRIDYSGDCKTNCDNFGLSFFETEIQASNRLQKYLDRKPNLAETLGNCIGKTYIKNDDGVAEKTDKSGHFNFHEMQKKDFEFTYTIVKKIEIV